MGHILYFQRTADSWLQVYQSSYEKLPLDIQTTYISDTEKYLSVKIKVSLKDVPGQICIKYFKSCKTTICSKHTQYVGSINETHCKSFTEKWNAETWICSQNKIQVKYVMSYYPPTWSTPTTQQQQEKPRLTFPGGSRGVLPHGLLLAGHAWNTSGTFQGF